MTFSPETTPAQIQADLSSHQAFFSRLQQAMPRCLERDLLTTIHSLRGISARRMQTGEGSVGTISRAMADGMDLVLDAISAELLDNDVLARFDGEMAVEVEALLGRTDG